LKDLVESAQRGDEGAFEQLYRENTGRIFALCLRLCGDSQAAMELTQDTFVRAWEQLGTFRGESAFSTWLHSLAVNVVLGARRRESRYRERVIADDAQVQAAQSFTGNPGDRVDLERAIAKLPEGARTALVLHDIEGYTHVEIGRKLGLSPGTQRRSSTGRERY
jgi:RNA polymerase sigma-70 factor (ECF subfamily)